MAEENKTLEEKVAFREHIATDMGNGGSYCSNCLFDLGPDPSKSYDKCPKCSYRLLEGSLYVSSGGSDF